jgi:hypothetical protein
LKSGNAEIKNQRKRCLNLGVRRWEIEDGARRSSKIGHRKILKGQTTELKNE